jgi:cytochrome c553
MFTASRAVMALVLSGIVTPCLAQSLEERLRGCDSCHGKQGIPRDSSWPVIGGQQQGYIDAALGDYKRGLRVSEPMAASVQNLGRLDIVAISAHYAQKPWPDLQ